MNKLKSTVAVLILIIALTWAYLIISGSNSPEPIEKTVAIETTGNNPVGIEPIAASDTSKNLTDLLTKKLEERIGEQNINGFQSLDGKTLINAPDPKKLTEELLSEAEKNFDANALRGIVEESRLKISEDISKESISKYFESFSQIMIQANKNAPASMSEPEKITISDFGKIRDMYEAAANNFYGLATPKSALTIHKKEIELLLTKKNIYATMANAEEDPMTAFLAVDELLKIEQEFDKLKADIGIFLKTV